MTLSCAIYSGLCASFASLFGKLSGLDFSAIEDVRLRYIIKAVCFCTMILLNSMVWTFFVKALQNSKTAIEATSVSTATNYILSGLLGFIAFGEITGLFWWFGISLIVIGIFIISGSNVDIKSEPNFQMFYNILNFVIQQSILKTIIFLFSNGSISVMKKLTNVTRPSTCDLGQTFW